MDNTQIFTTLMDLQARVSGLDVKVNWLIIGCLVPLALSVWAGWDNHKKQKAITNLLKKIGGE